MERGREKPTHGEGKKEKRKKRAVPFLFALRAHSGLGAMSEKARRSGGGDGQQATSRRWVVPLDSAGFFLRRVKRSSFKCPSGLSSCFALGATSSFGIGWQFRRLGLDVDVVVRALPSTARGSSTALYVALLAKGSTHWRAFPQGGIRVR